MRAFKIVKEVCYDIGWIEPLPCTHKVGDLIIPSEDLYLSRDGQICNIASTTGRDMMPSANSGEGSSSSGSEREAMMGTGMVVYSGSCDLGPSCERESFMNRCMEGMSGSVDTLREQTKRNCNAMAEQMLGNFRSNCEKRDFAYNNCIESTQKHCGPLTGAIERCRTINEDDIRSVIVEHGTKMCKFYENKDGFVSKMVEARKHLKDKSQLQLAFDDETNDVIETKEELKNIDEKDFGYKLKKFLGFAAEQERQDAGKLKQSSEKLKKTAEFLRDLADSSDNETGREALLEQADSLEKEAENLESMAEEKLKKAKGIWSILS